MSKLSINPLVLGIGAIAVATSGVSVVAADVDETLTSDLLSGSVHAITEAHEEGGCGEKEGDEEGKCGEGQCGEGHDDEGGEGDEGAEDAGEAEEEAEEE